MSTRSRLLAELKKKTGSYVSGELLSSILDISRSAVSKHISVLKQSGYTIEASPKVGYCLIKSTDQLLPDEIRDGLETTIIGRGEIHHFSNIDSTNNKAKELAASGLPDGSLIIAEKQTAGRGRKGRSWFSAEGSGISMSLVIRPEISPGEISRITLLTAVAAAEAIIALTPVKPEIKWPNDILVNGKKLAGILTEMTMEMDAIDYVVIGIGLNVNTPPDAFANEIRSIATSLYAETDTAWSRVDIVKAFLAHFERLYLSVLQAGFSDIIRRWKDLSNLIGKSVRVDVSGKLLTGTVSDIAEDGVLILCDDTGTEHRILSGDVLL